MFNKLRGRIARLIAPKVMQKRMYQSAKNSRLTSGWGNSNTSADSELVSSLTNLRSRSRALVRDAAYAKRAKVIVVNNVIGPGIGLQAQVQNTRGKLNAKINEEIEAVWEQWCYADSCHTGGTLHFSDFERACIGQIFEAGEVFIRKHFRKFGESKIPYALELIEAERIADEFQFPTLPAQTAPGTTVRMGIESDDFYRPIAYLVRQRHPSELRFHGDKTDKLERVPAEQIIHLRIVDRWPQSRGEPWMHAVIRKLNDMDGYSEAEIVAARGAASYMATIETPNESWGETDPTDPTAKPEIVIEPGIVQQLAVGDKLNFVSPNRPNANMDPFMRLMLREVAAGANVSYESLSRDYAQSNYSSSRLALLDDRDLWRMLQMWFIRSFRCHVHHDFMHAAVLSRAIKSIPIEQYALNPLAYEKVRYKPRGWNWVDPPAEVEAYKEAIKGGMTTLTDVIAQTGGGVDIEDVITTRKHELELMKEAGLITDTDPDMLQNPNKPAAQPAEQDTAPADTAPPKRVVSLQR